MTPMSRGAGAARKALALVLTAWVVVALTGCGDAADPRSGDDGGGTTTYTLPGGSMEPTLAKGGTIRVTEVGDDYVPERSSIVLYQPPADWRMDEVGFQRLVHRVIGVPGDTIECCDADGLLLLDGSPLTEDYVAPQADCNGPMVTACRAGWRVEVPDGAVFVMGDNRAAAADSSDRLCKRLPDPCTDLPSPFVPIDHVVGVVDEP